MNKRNNLQWGLFEAQQLEAVRRQRGHGRGGRRHETWSGPMGGPPPWVGQMFGPQFGGPGGPRGGRRPRVRRGDVRSAILDVLAVATEPINGYQVIQQIAERTDDAWKPSPGSVYPTMAQLTDLGCDQAQGFHIARPMPGVEVPRWLAARGGVPSPHQRRERAAVV